MLLTVKFPVKIESQKNAKLSFKFVGELNDKMLGFSRLVIKITLIFRKSITLFIILVLLILI